MFDFSKVDPDKVGDGIAVAVPKGVYEVEIASVKTAVTKGGKPQMEFKVAFQGAYKGATRTTWILIPEGPDAKVMIIWVRVFQSVGIPPEKLKARGRLTEEETIKLLTGKKAYVRFTPGNRDMGVYDQTQFVTKAAYEHALAHPQEEEETVAPSPAPANVRVQAPKAAPPAAAPSVANEDTDDLMSLLT